LHLRFLFRLDWNNKTQIFVVCKKHTSLAKTHRDWKWLNRKEHSKKMKSKNSYSIYTPIWQSRLQSKLFRRVKEVHFILIKRKINQEDITIINIHAPNATPPNFIKETWLAIKIHTGPDTIIVWDFNIPYSSVDISSRQNNEQTSRLIKQHLTKIIWT
jgi:hypothetical protein